MSICARLTLGCGCYPTQRYPMGGPPTPYKQGPRARGSGAQRPIPDFGRPLQNGPNGGHGGRAAPALGA